MNSVIITIGDELLIGQVIDTNSAWIADQLNLLGISVDEIVSISDSKIHIKDSLNRFEGNKDLIIITGGLGPTNDDITKKTLVEYFNSKLEMNFDVLNHIEVLFGQRGVKISDINRLQAMLPVDCKVLENPSGTAAGMWFERNNSIFISLPGVPYEMKDIFNQSLLLQLKKLVRGNLIVHRTIMTQGVPESILAEKIKTWEDALPENIKLAYLPRPGIVRLRLTAIGSSAELLKVLLEDEIHKLLNYINKDVYYLEDKTLESVVGELLKQKSKTLAIAESCTGGTISSLITSIPGSSKYYKGGVVAYEDAVKVSILQVDKRLIVKYGAVSQEVVEEMANGVRILLQADYSVATSGIAGPDGGTPEKPIGFTWIAVSTANKTISKQFQFGENRGRNIERASQTALNMLRKMILDIA